MQTPKHYPEIKTIGKDASPIVNYTVVYVHVLYSHDLLISLLNVLLIC